LKSEKWTNLIGLLLLYVNDVHLKNKKTTTTTKN